MLTSARSCLLRLCVCSIVHWGSGHVRVATARITARDQYEMLVKYQIVLV